MTLKELKQRVDTYYEMNERYHDLEVCIQNNKGGWPSWGGTSVTKVKYANRGIEKPNVALQQCSARGSSTGNFRNFTGIFAVAGKFANC